MIGMGVVVLVFSFSVFVFFLVVGFVFGLFMGIYDICLGLIVFWWL